MRRLTAYITTVAAMLLTVGVAANPVLTKLNGGREFENGRELIFNVNVDGETVEGAAQEIADEMLARLSTYNSIDDYSVKVQGDDTIVTSFKVNEEKEFNYVAKYLTFSGNNFIVSSHDTYKDEDPTDLFKLDEAKIEIKGDAHIPVVIVPVTENGKKNIEALQNEIKNNENEDKDTSIYVWANWEEGDTIDKANQPLVRDKVIMSFNYENIFYVDENKTDEENEKHEYIGYIVAQASADDERQIDLSGLENESIRSNYILSMLKANEYKVNGKKAEVTCPTRNVTADTVDYLENSIKVEASVEPIIELGNNISIRMSTVFEATLICILVISVILAIFYRLLSLAIISTTLGTVFATAYAFTKMSVLFNTPAIIGFILLACGLLVGEIAYANRFKEEVYKGRSVKKANQEASKKTNLITLDSAVVMAFAGLMMYALGGTSLKPMGVVLFFGAIFTLIMNLLVFKGLMYLVTNSTNLQNKYKVFNINEEKVPNLLIEESKPVYEAPYEKVDFTKKKSISSIVLGVLSLVSLVFIIINGVSNNSPLNVRKAQGNQTVIYTSLVAENSLIDDTSDFKRVLGDVEYANNKTLADCDTVEKTIINYVIEDEDHPETGREEKTIFFVTTINGVVDNMEDIESSITDIINDGLANAEDCNIKVSVRESKEMIYTPDQGLVALATGISIVGIALYCALRFGLSRGTSLLVTTAGVTTVSYGLFAIIPVETTAVTSLVMPLVAVTMMLASLFFFATEKGAKAESNEELTKEQKHELMIKSIGKAAASTLTFMLIAIYIAINFFGFAFNQVPFTLLFAAAILGDLIALITLLTIVGPFAELIAKGLSNIKLPKLKMFEQKENNVVRKNSSEPEETIFIGIND